MTRTTTVAVIALVVGGFGGATLSRSHWSQELNAVKAQRDQWQKQLRERVQWTEKQIRRLEALNRQLQEQVTAAQAHESRASEPRDMTQDFPAIEEGARTLLDDDGEIFPPYAKPAEPSQRPDRSGSAQTPPLGGDAAERRDFRAVARRRIGEFLQAELDRTTDPVAQERIKALGEYTDYMMDLWRQRSEAQTDEERDQADQALAQAGETVRSLVQEQQDALLRSVASEYGIKDPEQQKAFIASLRETQSSAFFRMPMPFWGGGVPRGSSPWHGGAGAPN